MLFKSMVYTQASGSIGGVTYSRNKGGMYTRARAVPINPNSPQQSSVRQFLSQLTSLWGGTLTQLQRDAWDTYAANVTVTNPLGDQVKISGFNHYIRSNVGRLQASLNRVDAAPTTFDLGSFTATSGSIIALTANLTLTFNTADAWVGETGSALIVQTSRSMSGTINYFKGPFRFADSVDGDVTTPPTSPASVPLAFPAVSGNVTYYRARVSRSDGRLSADQIVRVVAT